MAVETFEGISALPGAIPAKKTETPDRILQNALHFSGFTPETIRGKKIYIGGDVRHEPLELEFAKLGTFQKDKNADLGIGIYPESGDLLFHKYWTQITEHTKGNAPVLIIFKKLLKEKYAPSPFVEMDYNFKSWHTFVKIKTIKPTEENITGVLKHLDREFRYTGQGHSVRAVKGVLADASLKWIHPDLWGKAKEDIISILTKVSKPALIEWANMMRDAKHTVTYRQREILELVKPKS